MSLSCDQCALTLMCLPSTLTQKEIKKLTTKIRSDQRVSKSVALYQAGDTFHGLYAVKSGSFKSTLTADDGVEQIVSFYMPGELIGLDGYGTTHSATIIALEDSSVCMIPQHSLEELMFSIKGVAHYLQTHVAQELSAQNQLKLLIARKSAEERIVCFIKNMSDRFARRGFSAIDFTLSMSRGDIANFLGMAPETVSRLFAKLADQNILAFNRHNVHIIDTKLLSQCSFNQSDSSVARQTKAGRLKQAD